MRQKSDISELRSRHGRWITVQAVRYHLAPKINTIFFIRNWTPNIFLFDSFFEKTDFFEKMMKNHFGGIFNDFLGKGSVLP